MDVEKMSTCLDDEATNKDDEGTKDDELILPGFRFHPTDEELVGFYLRRKVEKKPISIELIKQVDIYKYDPWDLPKVSSVGEKEMYFFCIRGRKYRNSIRPNRVTGSGFWKATGIDKPIYSVTGQPHECIGLKKSLVYYCGSAGKGTKTDWMMHEFRLPPAGRSPDFLLANEKNIAQEAEVWTLCRIFKRNASYKKYIPADCSRQNFMRQNNSTDSSSKTCSLEEIDNNNSTNNEQCPTLSLEDNSEGDHQFNSAAQPAAAAASFPTPDPQPAFWSSNASDEEFFRDGNWDELRSVVDLAILDPNSSVYHCR